MKHNLRVATMLLIVALAVVSCGGSTTTTVAPPTSAPATQPTTAPTQPPPTTAPNIANPASTYCEKNGGKLEMCQDANGNVAGICKFSDGSECDEWAYYRGQCKPGDKPGTKSDIQTSGWRNILAHWEWVTTEEFQSPAGLNANGVMTIRGISGTFEQFRNGVMTPNGERLIWVGNKRAGIVQVQKQQWTFLGLNWTLQNYEEVLGGQTFQIKQADDSAIVEPKTVTWSP